MAEKTKKARKNKIAVFTNGWSCEFLSEVFEGIRKEAEADGVDIFVYLTYHLLFLNSKVKKTYSSESA